MKNAPLKLTLRDLFWLLLVVGMGVAWWLEHRELVQLRESAALRQENQNLLNALGGANAMLEEAADALYPLKK